MVERCCAECRGFSLIRNSAPLGPYSRNMRRALWWSWGEGLFLMSEVPLHHARVLSKATESPFAVQGTFCQKSTTIVLVSEFY